MVVAAVVCLALAALIGGTGAWTLARRLGIDLTGQVLRAVAPTQLGAAVMLAAGAIVSLIAPASIGRTALIVGALGAFATIAIGSWRAARYVERQQSTPAGCGSAEGCGGCAKACG